ncbi:hypothetical protein OSB04_023281 [Centaurea solstitialis]|uniref:Proteinase inhibitor n=1 Tax=Centaurea solstitialis TaxID=347529 RepID=A0AA38WAX1_9ASTR|nr:hypothetical protein OSB04_023281 [Centaurea solstitialis]
MTDCQGKSEWPELVGRRGDVAVQTIERENSLVDAMLTPVGSPVTGDFLCNRVRVRVNRSGIVVQIPEIG